MMVPQDLELGTLLLGRIKNYLSFNFKLFIILILNLNFYLTEISSKEISIIADKNNIEQLLKLEPYNIDFLFIYAKKKEEKGSFKEAEEIYKKIISLKPDQLRFYLDLAKIQFLNLDYTNSEKNFLYVYRKENIPPNVKYNIRNYLKILDNKKPKKINYTVKLSHNDNINNGTYADTVDLFGVPFKIDENAKAKSSYEFLTSVNGTNNFYLWDKKILSNFEINHSDFKQSDYDRLKLGFNVGPELKITNKMLSNLQFNYSKELLGGESSILNNSISLNFLNQVKPDLSILNNFSIGKTDYYDNSDYNSDVYFFQTKINKIYNRFNSNLSLKYSNIDSNKNIHGNIKKKIQFDTSTFIDNGFFIDFTIGKEISDYNEYQPIFSKTRKDNLNFFSLDLWNDRFYFGSFYPKLSFIRRENKSNINVYKTSSDSLSLYFIKDF